MKTVPPAKPVRQGKSGASVAGRPVVPPPQSSKVPTIAPRWIWHYRVLTRLRDHILQKRAEKLQEVAEAIEPHSMHLADSATDEFDHDLMLTLLAAEQNALNEVNDAILRIHAGRYGICEETGVPIGRERLRAVPWARYARKVEQALEEAGERPSPRLAPPGSIRGPGVGLAQESELPQETEPAAPRVPEVLEFAPEEEKPGETAAEETPAGSRRPTRAASRQQQSPRTRWTAKGQADARAGIRPATLKKD